MNQTVRVPLISKTERNGEEIPYADICRVLWDLQRYVREIKNKTVQTCWEWQGFCTEFKDKNGEYPVECDFLFKTDDKTGEIKDYSLNGYVYDKFKDYLLYSSNISAATQDVIGRFNKSKGKILSGEMSLMSYKQNQPIDLCNRAIKLEYEKNKFCVSLSLLNTKGKKEYNISTPFLFEMTVKDKSTRTILERCIDGIYKISGSKLIYNKKKKQWFLNLSYSFEAKNLELDKDTILGIDLGVACPVVASVFGDKARFVEKGGQVETFRKRIEARRNSVRSGRRFCGEGSVGHGYHTRMKPSEKLSGKIAAFRDTYNHNLSKAVIDYAVKNNCGTIQMEKLKDIKAKTRDKKNKENKEETSCKRTNKMRFLQDWTYYDLQSKIEYKAKAKGIEVIYVDPKYTSQRCSQCGAIHKESRPEQKTFSCIECGFSENADYNASQNLAVRDIDKVIEQSIKECEP